jgi:cystathionine gamma-synthase
MTHFATTAVRSGIETDTQHGAITPPIYLTSNYSFEGFGKPRQYDYARSGNPTRAGLEGALADLEQGAGATVTSSGMSAVSLPLQLLIPGDILIAPHDCYGGSYRLFTNLAARGQFELIYVDQTDEVALQAALDKNPKMLWIESPSNPLLRVVDIERLSGLAKDRGCLTVVDNTFLSPVQQQPLNLGADIVVHSTTKYINGHSDVVGGGVISKDPLIAEKLAWWGNCLGITGSPFDSFLTLRGLRTLPVRIRQHQIAKKQQQGFGAIVSFELDETRYDIARFLEQLEMFSLAESLGGVESLICHPSTMTHAAMDEPAQVRAGITGQLIRVSVGIELADDLLEDLKKALALSSLPNEVSNSEELSHESC